MPYLSRVFAPALAALALTGCAQKPAGGTAGAALAGAPTQQGARCDKPVWPAGALQARYTGVTTLRYLMGTDGAVLDTQVTKSSGHPILDDATQAAFRRCRFNPVIKDGKPVQAWYNVQYHWQIK